jgi:RNA polymerase sigma-70 factor (ECF subfamily)
MGTPKQSFKSFYQMYFNSIIRFAMYYLEDNSEGEDVAQETFLKVYERWDTIGTEQQMRSYLYITAKNLCFDRLRHQNVKEEYRQQTVQNYHTAEKEDDDEKFLSEVTYQETLRQLYKAINGLAPQTKRIILMGLKGKSNGEIAQELEISINTVKSLKKSAYKTLRNNVDKSILTENAFAVLLMFVTA